MFLSVFHHNTGLIIIIFQGNSGYKASRVLHVNLLRSQISVFVENPLSSAIFDRVTHPCTAQR